MVMCLHRQRRAAAQRPHPCALGVEPLEGRVLLAASLVYDANLATASSSPTSYTPVGSIVFFAASDGNSGVELWKTEGTAAGTVLVRDINPGLDPFTDFASSTPRSMAAVGNTLMFFADDGVHGTELWKSDGTAAGTMMVKDINPGASGGGPSFDLGPYNGSVLSAGGVFYFTANDGVHGIELWKSDGTAAGTVMVRDIFEGGNGSEPTDLVPFDGAIYFAARDNTAGRELWKTDGTAAGTVRVTDAWPGAGDGAPETTDSWSRGRLIAPFGGHLYFRGHNGSGSPSLWRTDGTAAGTIRFQHNEQTSWPAVNPSALAVAGDRLYYMAKHPGITYLWQTDGTAAGTKPVQDAVGRPIEPSRPDYAVVGDTLYLAGYNQGLGIDLWRTDGTPAGTMLLPSAQNPHPGQIGVGEVENVNGTVFFVDFRGFAQPQLWKTDGTVGGTEMVKELPTGEPFNSGVNSDYVGRLTAVGDRLHFGAHTASAGAEPWSSDGTAAGTVMLKDVNATGADSNPHTFFVASDGDFYFSAADSTVGRELFKTDAATGATVLIRDANPGRAGSSGRALGEIGGQVIFAAFESFEVPARIYRTDGTPQGTEPLFALTPTFTGFQQVGDTLYLATHDGASTAKLWQMGPDLVLRPVAELSTARGASNGIRKMAAFKGELYFRIDGVGALYRSDGTPEGTTAVYNAGAVDWLTPTPDALYFTGHDGFSYFVWKYDGTGEPTKLTPRLHGASYLSADGSTLYFSASPNFGSPSLWRSDGTPGGTAAIADVIITAPVTVVGNTIYFIGPLGGNGAVLWKTNGRPFGTDVVQDAAGNLLRVPLEGSLVNFNGTLYLSASTSAGEGPELWKTDGTRAGTVKAAEIRPGPPGSRPALFTPAGEALYFTAIDGTRGRELWKYTEQGVPAASVAGRHVFYNRSGFDGNDSAANEADDGAVARDKQALLPGQGASFSNVTSYVRGVNGVMVDIANLPAGSVLTTDDFDFGAALRPVSVTVRRGAGVNASDRVTLTWTDYSPGAETATMATANGWLTVTVKANSNTGLSAPDVFSFGNLAGETGNSATSLAVNPLDLALVRRNLFTTSPVTGRYDFNRDGRVGVADYAIARANYLRRLALLAPNAPVPAAPLFSERPAGTSLAEDLLA